jgi:mannose-6-phosphate isomerase-like protein (cupin superfamily)
MEDIAAEAVLVLDKPYGKNHILIDSGDFGLSCARLLPGRTTSLHTHAIRREFFCVRRGAISLTLGDTQRRLGRLAHAGSTPGVPHALANDGHEPAEVLEMFAPALLDDKHRILDPYARRLGPVGVFE